LSRSFDEQPSGKSDIPSRLLVKRVVLYSISSHFRHSSELRNWSTQCLDEKTLRNRPQVNHCPLECLAGLVNASCHGCVAVEDLKTPVSGIPPKEHKKYACRLKIYRGLHSAISSPLLGFLF